MVAVVTPLASILGSGLLIIVPVLEGTLGALSVVGAVAVCAVAWLAGTAVRHCVLVVEPLTESGDLDATTRRLDRLADAVIVVAYVISVALYLRIMAQYVVGYFAPGGRAGHRKAHRLWCGDGHRDRRNCQRFRRAGSTRSRRPRCGAGLDHGPGWGVVVPRRSGVPGCWADSATGARCRDSSDTAGTRRHRHHGAGLRDGALTAAQSTTPRPGCGLLDWPS
jgi:hypothetical protein